MRTTHLTIQSVILINGCKVKLPRNALLLSPAYKDARVFLNYLQRRDNAPVDERSFICATEGDDIPFGSSYIGHAGNNIHVFEVR